MMCNKFAMGTLTNQPQNALNQSTINLSVNISIHYLPKWAISHIVGGVVKFRNCLFSQHMAVDVSLIVDKFILGLYCIT